MSKYNSHFIYEYEKIEKKEKISYEFQTEDGDKYLININNCYNILKIESLKDIYELEFGVIGQNDIKIIMNKGKIYTIMNTLKEIILDFMFKYDFKEIRIKPERNYKDDKRRYNLFNRYIKNHLPNNFTTEHYINNLTKKPFIKIIKNN